MLTNTEYPNPLKWRSSCMIHAARTSRLDVFLMRLKNTAETHFWPKHHISVVEEKSMLLIVSSNIKISVFVPEYLRNVIFLKMKEGRRTADQFAATELAAIDAIGEYLFGNAP